MSSKNKTTATKEEAKPALVPKLRFPEFRGAEAWKPVTLQQASTPVTERVGERKLTPVSISAGIGFVPQAEKFGRDISGNQYQLYTLVSDGDFVYNKGNSLKFPQGCVYQLQGWGQVAAPNVFICFRLKGGYSNVFFQNCFEQNMHGKQLKKHITSGARSNGLLNISKENFFGVEIPTPSPAEQQKIAECLSSVDELMAAQARKVDALKTHKKGLMQQLFPRVAGASSAKASEPREQDAPATIETQPRLRFPEFQNAGEWDKTTIGDLKPFVTSGSRGWAPFYAEQGELFVRITNLWRDSIYLDLAGSKFVQLPPGANEGVRTQLREHDVLISITADIGIIGYVDESVPSPAYINQHIALVRFDSGQLFGKYVAYFLASEKSQRLFRASTDTGTKAGMSLIGIQKIELMFPGLPEQQRIASCLSSLDALITAETQKLEALKTHKKGLMQQLFPSPEAVEA
ncbi:restriction endonuclease subunit S [Metallibacterium scheffleri]|uniref:Restriction endonuclease subunit R n=1 Tax=Metallibacterium scheffleri TaxID=993689 RepID=A0A4S3KKU6_9GAMM|nr:restriction endonuclease subunit S [Metallibacterium scheffleri]THD09386.1 restriction endonuclease subunit R [Metallibacterium scheffleri]